MQLTKTNTNLMIEKQESLRMECEAVCEWEKMEDIKFEKWAHKPPTYA